MSYMFEIYSKPPRYPRREAVLTEQVSHFGGRLSFREGPDEQALGGVCLTYDLLLHPIAGQLLQVLRVDLETTQRPR